jgi:hypothetical protein
MFSGSSQESSQNPRAPGTANSAGYTFYIPGKHWFACTHDEEDMTSNRKALFFIHCCIAIAGFHAPGALAQGAKVDVCHIPLGNPDNVHTITISINALETHLNHGDSIGVCESEQTPGVPPSEAQAPKVDVCHIPPGNPENAHTITISENALDSHLEHGDYLGACEPAQPPGVRPSACICPRPGVWRVTNLEGWMECNVMGIKRKLKGSDKNDGAIWILNDDCSTIFSEAYKKDHEDVLMDRGPDCLFFGFAAGEEEGAEVLFDGAYKVETEEFITGEFYLEMSSMAMGCSGYRPFEINFLEPLSEKDYAKQEKRMQEKLEQTRKVLDEHREQIDRYIEKTDGGKALGGRNGQE